VRWLFPGSSVRLDAPCLDCGLEMTVEMRDEDLLRVEPDTLVGYTSSEVGGDASTRPFR